MTILPQSLVVKVSDISAAQGALIGEEFRLLADAKPSRQREIIAGRVLARRAMMELGHPQSQVTQYSSGAPIWPVGLCGSIAHSANQVAVAIAHTSHVRSIGVDIEDGRNLGSAESEVGIADEIKSLTEHPLADDWEGAVRLLFSAKEAIYKCQAPLSGNLDLDFRDVRLEMVSDGHLRADPVGCRDNSFSHIIRHTEIFFKQIQGLTIAIAWIPAQSIFV